MNEKDLSQKIDKKLEQQYYKNLDYFKKYYNDLYSIIISFNQQEKYTLTIEDTPNIKINETGEFTYPNNSILQANDLAQNGLLLHHWLDLKNGKNIEHTSIDKAIFISNGLALHLKEYDKKFDIKSILIVEEDTEIFKLSCYYIDYEELSNNKQMLFCVGETKQMFHSYVLRFFHSMFYYNDNIKIIDLFQNNLMQELSAIFSKSIDKNNCIHNIDYKKGLVNFENRISSEMIDSEIEKVENIYFKGGRYQSNIYNLLNLIEACSIKKMEFSKKNQLLGKLYLIVTDIVTLSQNEHLAHIIYHNIQYLVETEKQHLFDDRMYNYIIRKIKNTHIDIAIYFSARYTEYLKVLNASIEKIKHSEYIYNSLQSGNKLSKSTPEYVKKEFDEFAKSFETQLEKLEYTVPEVLSKNVKENIDLSKKYDLLDLGCGTGLLGIQVQNITNSMVGIDLSTNMLAEAKKKDIYTNLIESDIEKYLNTVDKDIYDIVVSSDVFIYIGDVSTIFSQVTDTLKEDGVFAFSIELLESKEEYKLNNTGRFSHSLNYIENLAANNKLEIIQKVPIVIRKELGKDVSGYIFVLLKKGKFWSI